MLTSDRTNEISVVSILDRRTNARRRRRAAQGKERTNTSISCSFDANFFMNASCALHHFCDSHGLQILLCTEAKIFLRTLDNVDNEILKTFYSQYVVTSDNGSERSECKVRGEENVFRIPTSSLQSCTLSSDVLLVSTTDVANHLLFISSASTPNPQLFKTTRNACVRSLNIEVKTPGENFSTNRFF